MARDNAARALSSQFSSARMQRFRRTTPGGKLRAKVFLPLNGRRWGDAAGRSTPSRFGISVKKALGGAVVRNRITPPHPRNSAAQQDGDSYGMGHRDSSDELGGAGAFRASGGGTGAPAALHSEQRAEQRSAPRAGRGAEDMSFPARALLFAVRVYQSFFSALMPSACKFYPSCSQYAADAVRIHGARRGSWLALRRLSRCHPFTPGGVDLVPDAREDSTATLYPEPLRRAACAVF